MAFVPMKKTVLKKVLERPQVCVRSGEGSCDGRITIEHVFGRKKETEWSCILLCERHHSLGNWQNNGLLNKAINRLHAYQQATDEEIKKTYPKNWQEKLQDKKWLESKYKHLL